MRDFREILPRLQAFRSKFEDLLAAARKNAAQARVPPAKGYEAAVTALEMADLLASLPAGD